MADYSMENEKWNGRKDTCIAWFEANPDLAIEEDREMLAMGFFRVGDNRPENRVKYWTAICSLFAGLPNSPVGPGRSSNMTIGQKSQLDLWIAGYEVSRTEAFNEDEYLQTLSNQHGKSGGKPYRLLVDGDEIYAKYEAKKARSYLVRAFNAAFKGDDEATHYWPTMLHEDGETQILDFSLFESNEGANDGYPNVLYRASEEEE
jgi:hypothetical protein